MVLNSPIAADFRLPTWPYQMQRWEEMREVCSFEQVPAGPWAPTGPNTYETPHLRTVLYRLELRDFVGHLICIYVANKEFLQILNFFFWKIQLSTISAELEQNTNHNIYCCPRSVWHILLIKLLFLMRQPARFCPPFFLLSTYYFNH